MQSTLIDIVPKVMLKAIKKYVAFTDFEFTDENIESLKYYHSVFDPTSDGKEIMEQFANCCETGELEVLKWLVSIFPISKEDIMYCRKYYVPVINLAYYNSNTNVTEWLERKFHLHVKKDKDYVLDNLLCACEQGNLDLVKKIIETSGLDIKDITRENNYLFRETCRSREIEVAKWLEDTYNVLELSENLADLREDVFRVYHFLPKEIIDKINSMVDKYYYIRGGIY